MAYGRKEYGSSPSLTVSHCFYLRFLFYPTDPPSDLPVFRQFYADPFSCVTNSVDTFSADLPVELQNLVFPTSQTVNHVHCGFLYTCTCTVNTMTLAHHFRAGNTLLRPCPSHFLFVTIMFLCCAFKSSSIRDLLVLNRPVVHTRARVTGSSKT